MRLIYQNYAPFCKVINKTFMAAYDKPSFAKLESRSIFIVNGPETRKFLQGVTTNNISPLYEPSANKQKPRVALYTLFMNPKGKVVSDGFIIRPQIYQNGVKKFADNELWIDLAKDTSTQLFEHLRKYTWKKQVEITNISFEEERPDIHVGFNKIVSSDVDRVVGALNQMRLQAGHALEIQSEEVISQRQKEEDEGAYANVAFFDPRGIKFGIRMICGTNGFKYVGQVQKSTEKQYQKISKLNGISSSNVMVNKLPFMFNSDLFNGFSFNKGCYLGQEIVARAYFTGIVRRRIFPFVLENSEKSIQAGQTLYGQNKQQLGKVVQTGPGYGTVLCNYLPFLQRPWPLKIVQPSPGSIKMPFAAQLHKYIEDIKAKQAKLQQIDL